ncbi:unnamed protein product, partial [Sphacelaria rigidula]
FTTALNEASSGGRSYLPTKHLQLASLQLCIACRGVSTLLVKFDGSTPRRLWADPAEQSPTVTAGSMGSNDNPRVPLLRAHSIVWTLSANAAIMLCKTNLLSNVRNWYFDRMFDRSLDYIIWPPQVRKLVFRSDGSSMRAGFNQPITKVVWPSSLQQLTFGTNFNQPIEGVEWPASLQQLKFGADFNQSIKGMTWPASLQQLTLDFAFNQPIARVAWPASLQHLR